MYEAVEYETMPTLTDVLGYKMPEIREAMKKYQLKYGKLPTKISLPKVYIFGMEVDFREEVLKPIIYRLEDRELIFRNE